MDNLADLVGTVAGLMTISARIAPKAKGIDMLSYRILMGEDLIKLAAEVKRYGEEMHLNFFLRDAKNIESSDACVIIGLNSKSITDLNCGACGFARCEDMQNAPTFTGGPFSGPNCQVRVTDLGIAVGSAVKTAQMHNIDNRVMFTAGVGAIKLGFLPGCNMAYGIPLKAGGKNIFFDRIQG